MSAPVSAASSYTSTSSLFARNSADLNPDFFGLFNQVDHTLVMDGQGAAGITGGVNGNLVNVDAMLDVLRDNGGPTQTIALLPGSPALDAGFNPDGLDTDQRGQSRVSNFRPDIGAFERFVFPVLSGGIGFRVPLGPRTFEVASFDNGNPAGDPTQLTTVINWGDGRTTSGTISLQSGVTYVVDGSHAYQQAGSYQITVTLSNTSGDSSTAQDTADVTASLPPPPPPPPPTPAPPPPPPPPPAAPLPQFAASVVRKKGKFLVQITDVTGAKRFSRPFPSRVQVLRQDMNGDGVLDLVLQYRQGRKLRRLAFSGRDLTPLPA
jgi:hypothetical protein